MKNITLIAIILFVYTVGTNDAFGQSFDLQQQLKENKLITFGMKVVSLPDTEKKGISVEGIAYLKNIDFSEGTIEVDLRGKDILQQSFLGIVFHGADTLAYDCIYFRPFNFNATDSTRKIHAVQYITYPEFGWEKLRKEHNGVYEKGITPPPPPTAWLHAKITVKGEDINVYVNNAKTPSLTVKKLNTRTGGQIGLWNSALPGDFANLTIKKDK